MKTLDLLENHEQQQLDLLMYLNDLGGHATKKKILTHFDIGEYLLKKILNQLQELEKLTKNAFTINIDKQNISLQIKANFSIDDISHLIITQSSKYILLENLFVDGSLQSRKICQKKNFSHTVYLKKIKELNQLLEKFGLTIHNNQLVGSELQIRFFFTTFFGTFNPPIHILNFKYNQHTQESADKIQTILTDSQSEYNYKREILSIYLAITKKRYAQRNRQDSQATHNPYLATICEKQQQTMTNLVKQTEFFTHINTIMSEFLVDYSHSVLPHETLITILFIMGNEMILANSKVAKELKPIEKQIETSTIDLFKNFVAFRKNTILTNERNEKKQAFINQYLTYNFYQPIYLQRKRDKYQELHKEKHPIADYFILKEYKKNS